MFAINIHIATGIFATGIFCDTSCVIHELVVIITGVFLLFGYVPVIFSIFINDFRYLVTSEPHSALHALLPTNLGLI